MAGPPWGSDPQDPSDLFILGSDGARDQAPANMPPPRRPAGNGRRWSVLTVAGLLVFGLGVAVGTHLGDGPSSAGSPTPNDVATPPGHQSSAPTTAPSATSSSSAGARAVTASPSWAWETATSTSQAAPWPTARGACDAEVRLPILSDVRDLKEPTGLELLTGSDPRPLDVDKATVGRALFDLAPGEFVSQLAIDAAGTVALISDCHGYPPVRLVRRSADGYQRSFAPALPGYQLGSLIAGGDRTWLALTRTDSDADVATDRAVLLQSTDGARDRIKLPAGFSPMAGSGDMIVGNWSDNLNSAYGPIQLYSVSRRGIVAQLGGTSPQYAVGSGFVVWTAGTCTGSCPVHRYRIATGQQTTVTVAGIPAMSWQTISPDGSKIAGVSYGNPDDPRFDTDHPGGPTRLAVMDLHSGTVTTLPGLEMAPKSSASLAFSPDGRWLVVAVNTGSGTTVLLYDQRLDGPLDPGVGVSGPTLWNAPLVVTSTAG
jgi:hypothetical protein